MRRAIAVAIASCVFVLPTMVQADTFSWGVSSGSWSVGPNWNGGVSPSSSATNTLLFNGATAWSSSDDLGGSFSLNALSFASTGGGTLSTLPGNSLNFVVNGTTNPTISMTGSGNVSLSSSMNIANPLTITVSSGAGVLSLGTSAGGLGNSNWLTGSQGLTINNSSTNALVLYGSNSFSGAMTVGPLTATTPGIQIGSAGALRRARSL